MKHGWNILIVVIIASIAAVVLVDGVLNEDNEDFTLPVIHIDTKDGEAIDTKTDYVKCTISIENSDIGEIVDDESGKIKGRGNSTWDKPSWWYMPKKPYKFQFDREIDLFGNGAHTTWTLIANYSDPSLSRDYFAYTVGAAIGLEETTTVQCVNLYLNGVYQGEYLLCEQVEVAEGRVEILEMSDDGDYGFLVEMDGWILSESGAVEGLDYFFVNGATYTPKDMRGDDATAEITRDQVELARQFLEKAEDAIVNGSYADVCELVDVRSFALTYIVNELFHTQDVCSGSFYMHRTAGGKLVSGPIWDFDNSSGNANNTTSKDPEKLWAANENRWYRELLQHEEFRDLVSQLLEENEETIRSTIDEGYTYLKAHKYDFRQNFVKWPTLGSMTGANPLEFMVIDTWDGHLKYLRNWLYASLDHMMSVYCPE